MARPSQTDGQPSVKSGPWGQKKVGAWSRSVGVRGACGSGSLHTYRHRVGRNTHMK